jgi:signal recognition particle subunit SRP14
MAAPSSEQEYPCLLRASDGHTANFSTKVGIVFTSMLIASDNRNAPTQIQPGDLPKFNAAYGTLLKSSMTTLRKRDKKKEKRKAEAAALRKKKLMEPITVLGSKRGNGRRKRQRRIKAVIKQDEARKRFEEREEVKTRGTTY